MILIPLAGIFKDLITTDPVGTSVLALLPVVPLAAMRERWPTESEFVPTVAVVAAAEESASGMATDRGDALCGMLSAILAIKHLRAR